MTRIIALIFFLAVNITLYAQEYRAYSGHGNNIDQPELGAKGSLLLRESAANFVDDISIPKLDETFGRPNPRVISNQIFTQSEVINDELNLSDFTWAFAQLVGHDIYQIETDPNNIITNIVVPEDDNFFSPGTIIPMLGSVIASGTGSSVQNPANYQNKVSAFVDGSAIYGSDIERANWLRSFNNGKLKTSSLNFLPWNTIDGEFNTRVDVLAPQMIDVTETGTTHKLMVAGDSRANENPLLLSFHVLFVREHNRLCDKLAIKYPSWTDEDMYQRARAINISLLQNIVFNEWLPSMGVNLPKYSGYKSTVNPSIYNVFSAAAFKLRHTLVNSNILRLDNDGNEVQKGHLGFKEGFYKTLVNFNVGGGIDAYFKGMAFQTQQEMDCKVVDEIRNFIIPGSNDRYDIASININRGRERGLPSYNGVREAFGLPLMKDFYALTKNHEEAEVLNDVYGDINNLDAWVGMVGEYHMPDAIMGRLILTIMERQFQSIRDGDRFYFENDDNLSIEDKKEILNTNMRDIVMRNTNITDLQKNVFKATSANQTPDGPIPTAVDLKAIAFPNPTSNVTYVNIHSSNIQDVKFEIYDNMGRVIQWRTEQLESGVNKVYFDTSNLLRGMYNIRISNGSHFNVIRLIKE